MKYDFLVFIGRFQPFHDGHKRVIDHALTMADHVIILVGSDNVSRSLRNPWTFEERAHMILGSYPYNHLNPRVYVHPLADYIYMDNAWVEQVQHHVNQIILNTYPGNSPHNTLHGLNDMRIGLIGCAKDHTSYYLKMFPMWGSEDTSFLNPINATDIRDEYFGFSIIRSDQIPDSTYRFMAEWVNTEECARLRDEYHFIQTYKKQWESVPYPPTFVTVDAVVVQSGHVLLVKRGASPGLGQIALPGGFLNQDERIDEAVIRELREETGIKVPAAVLKGSVVRKKVFDDPHRSSRGRTITHAHLIQLEGDTKLPKVKGGDDADKAFWMPLSEVKARSRDFFEDHWFIIQNMVS